MSDMVTFSTALLSAVAEFLATPPIFYLFGAVILCFIVKAVKLIIR